MLKLLILIIALSFIYYLFNYILTEKTKIKKYKFVSGEDKGNYDTFTNKLIDEMPIKNINTNGSKSNLVRVHNYRSDFGLAQEDLFFDSVQSLNAFRRSNPFSNLRFISACYFEKAHFIVNSLEIGVNSFPDLKNVDNFIVGVGEKNSGSHFNFTLMCLLNGINPKDFNSLDTNAKIKYKTGNLNLLMNDYKNGLINGLYLMTGNNNIYIKNLVKLTKSKFINLYDNNSPLLKTVFKNYFYKKFINLGDYYDEITEAENIPTISTRSILFTHDKTPNDLVYELTKKIYSNHIDINCCKKLDYEPIDLAYCREEYKIHPGAHKYLMEVNLISNQEKWKYNLEWYHDNVLKNYWKYPRIGDKKFNFSSII